MTESTVAREATTALADRIIAELEREKESTVSGREFVDWDAIVEVIRRVCKKEKP